METGCKKFTYIVASSHRVHKNLYALELMSVQWRKCFELLQDNIDFCVYCVCALCRHSLLGNCALSKLVYTLLRPQ